MKQIRIGRAGARRERRWHEVLPLDPRDSDVVLAKARARARDRAGPGTAKPPAAPAREDRS